VGKARTPGATFTSLDRADAIAIGAERRAGKVKIAPAFRCPARHRPVVFPEGALILVQDDLRLGEKSLSGRVGEPRLVIRMHVRHYDRVDVDRRDVDGLQVLREAPNLISLPGEA
jgi:hypothetical protein